jgi:hypothetical protein
MCVLWRVWCIDKYSLYRPRAGACHHVPQYWGVPSLLFSLSLSLSLSTPSQEGFAVAASTFAATQSSAACLVLVGWLVVIGVLFGVIRGCSSFVLVVRCCSLLVLVLVLVLLLLLLLWCCWWWRWWLGLRCLFVFSHPFPTRLSQLAAAYSLLPRVDLQSQCPCVCRLCFIFLQA